MATNEMDGRNRVVEPGERIPVTDLMRKLNEIVDAYLAQGEVMVVLDIFTVKNAVTLHVPIPHGYK